MQYQLRLYHDDERLLSPVLMAVVLGSVALGALALYKRDASFAGALVGLWAAIVNSSTTLDNRLTDAIDAAYSAAAHDRIHRLHRWQERLVRRSRRFRRMAWGYAALTLGSFAGTCLELPYADLPLRPIVEAGPTAISAALALLFACVGLASLLTYCERVWSRRGRGDLYLSPVLTVREATPGLRRLADAGVGMVLTFSSIALMGVAAF